MELKIETRIASPFPSVRVIRDGEIIAIFPVSDGDPKEARIFADTLVDVITFGEAINKVTPKDIIVG